VALVTGGNRGIGLAVCRGLAETGTTVLVGSRNPKRGEAAATGLREEGLEVRPLRIDITDPGSVGSCAKHVLEGFRRLDVLVNNAGVYLDGDAYGPLEVGEGVVRRTFEVNFYGPLRTGRACVPSMVERGYGRWSTSPPSAVR
jgi:NAD(P)-dependent dehydrogenase (short-subunit alcohol dehydrogenase family)